jgi:UrcA family protein
MSIVTRALAAALVLSLAAPAIAGNDGTITTSVRVKRIAVRSPQDARRLDRRIADAALQACGAEDHDLSEMRGAIRHSSCYADAMRDAHSSTATASAAPVERRARP